ncbi:MAG TPA: PHP domain-containing protein [Thermomicrobiales bacterium]|nr:PHP domain-containing protein [Thermomicrobiales bacterium]
MSTVSQFAFPMATAIGPTAAVDLHLHTLASDGFWTPPALIDHLAERGFRVVAVCDHDTQRSVAETMRLGDERGIVVVPGVEMTTNWSDRQWHLLVYGIAPDRTDPAAAPFKALLTEIDARLQRAAGDAWKRIEASGRALPSLGEVMAGRPLWPFHVLSSAIKEGHVKNLTEAANLVVELGGTFTADLPLGEVVAAAHEAGGICVVAHPGRSDSVGIMTEADLDRMLAEIPIDGLEAHYRSYTDEQTATYRRLAEERGLLISCGSDSHAPKQPVDPRPWRAVWCADLLRRLGVDVAPAEGETWARGMDPEAVVPQPDPAPQSEPPGEQLMDAEAELEPAGVAAR